VNNYVERGEKAKPILQPFEAWFVLQWIVHFSTIFVGIMNIVTAYLQDIQHDYKSLEKCQAILAEERATNAGPMR